MADRIPARLTAREGRGFGLTVGAAFLVLATLVWWRAQGSLAAFLTLPTNVRFRHGLAAVFGLLGVSLVMAGLAIPTHLGGVQRAWMKMAHAISKVTTPIFMGVVFFVVITPIGLLMRLLGRRSLVHRERDGGFWMAPASGGRSDIERQF